MIAISSRSQYAPPCSATRFIRSLDVRMNSISDADAVFVKAPTGAEADRTRVAHGDVLLTITGSRIGRVAAVPERLKGSFISQHVAILRLKEGLLPEFLSMFLSLDTGGQRQIERLQYGQTKPGLNLDQIREMRVPVPQLCHQQEFLALVERVEHLRAVQREALRQAEHLFASLLNRAFSG
jgi:type I restriction enzyme S subunit